MKKFRIFLTLLALAAVLAGMVGVVVQQRTLAEKVVRLHVVANSDGERDQQTKLYVRDAVLDEVASLTADCAGRAQVLESLRRGLPRLRRTAQEALRRTGDDLPVTVTLGEEHFPTRVYDTFALPAGRYLSLRVSLGEAAGRNWWCVIFPTLCTAAQTDDLRQVAASAGFNDGEIGLITRDAEEYEFKFKLLEGLEKLRALFAE